MNNKTNNIKIYMVGDSTVSPFNDPYYYPRYGYGTQLSNYLVDGVEVINLAMSGRSSKSFLLEDNYKILSSSIEKGDFLIIGFGHNDEKHDDLKRFSTALESSTVEGSFKYYLYNYYIKLASEKKATPILCTPICRANEFNDYTKESGHITKYGDYRKAILELGKETNTEVVDLTSKTENLYKEIGFEKATLFHARIKEAFDTVDKTHLNYYGAKMISYILASEIKTNNYSLATYILNDCNEPKLDELQVNPNYINPDYIPFDSKEYNNKFDIKEEALYGTVFGDCAGDPSDENLGYIVKEVSSGVYHIGQSAKEVKGKIASTEGIAMLFRQIEKNCNFKATVKAKIIKEENVSQSGFGLMLRDDIYINQTSSNKSIVSNYVSAGLYNDKDKSNIIYARENAELKSSLNKDRYYQEGDILDLSIERLGQVAKATVRYNNESYSKDYPDFDFFAIDNNYMYLGLYATRGTVVEFYDFKIEFTGKAIEA